MLNFCTFERFVKSLMFSILVQWEKRYVMCVVLVENKDELKNILHISFFTIYICIYFIWLKLDTECYRSVYLLLFLYCNFVIVSRHRIIFIPRGTKRTHYFREVCNIFRSLSHWVFITIILSQITIYFNSSINQFNLFHWNLR